MVAPVTGTESAVVTRQDSLVLAPFRALRYDAARIADLAAVTSPPYDVLDADDVTGYEQADPFNVVRLILPRDADGEPGSRYPRAAETLASWRQAGVLQADSEPALYVYEESSGDGDRHVQRGLVGAVGLAQPAENIILPHENTMAGPVADRFALTVATEANLEPIFLVYAGGGAASAAVAGVDTSPPLLSATTADGITHRIWALRDPDTLAAVAADLAPRRAVIADGHHRYATYLRHQADRHAAGAGSGPWDYGLALLVDSTAFGPQVHAIHRVVPGLPLETAVAQARGAFRVAEVSAADATSVDATAPSDATAATAAAADTADADTAAAADTADAVAALAAAGASGPAFLLAAGNRFVLLTEPDADALAAALPPDRSTAWRSLDVTVAHSLLISAVWRLADNEDVVGYAHDAAAALAAADASGGTAVLLNPTPVDAVTAVAAAGERMPRKSTLFTPKPRTGLLMRAFADS